MSRASISRVKPLPWKVGSYFKRPSTYCFSFTWQITHCCMSCIGSLSIRTKARLLKRLLLSFITLQYPLLLRVEYGLYVVL